MRKRIELRVVLEDVNEKSGLEPLLEQVTLHLEGPFWRVKHVSEVTKGEQDVVARVLSELFQHESNDHIRAAIQHLQRWGRPKGDVNIQHGQVSQAVKNRKSQSVRSVSGGLPTLGKRRK